jgi:hypothetical protein
MLAWARLSVVAAALFLISLARAQDAGAQALLEKAIKAAGGEAKLAKLQALTLKGKGKIFDMNQEIPFSASFYTQGSDQGRIVTEMTQMGNKITEVRVINKDKGWVRDNQQPPQPMSKEMLIEEKESLYFNYITTLAPLKGKDFKLAALPEIKVDDKPAIGLTVASKGHREVKLYFDKESSLLVKSERLVKDPDSGKESTEEVLFGNYKEFDGIKIATKYTIKAMGKTSAEMDVTDAKPSEKLEATLFDKP